MYTVSPIFQPKVRKTFVAPRLPLPTVRRSTPFALPARKADGMDPTRYATARPTAGCISRPSAS